MTLSKQALETLATIDNLTAQLHAEQQRLSDQLEECTGGVYSVCVGRFDGTTQLYYNREVLKDDAAAYEMLREMADDGDVRVGWSDDEHTSYILHIDRHLCCVLFPDRR